MHLTTFINSETGPRGDGRYDAALVLNLTGKPLLDSVKQNMNFESAYGYGDSKQNFSAVLELVDTIGAAVNNPRGLTAGIVRTFRDTAIEHERKNFIIRTYLTMLPNRGDPRVGFCLCSHFVNNKGKVFINLYEPPITSRNPNTGMLSIPVDYPTNPEEKKEIIFTKYINNAVGKRSDGRYETVFILNLTGLPIGKRRKESLEYDALHGYGESTQFGAVFEYVDHISNHSVNPQSAADEIANGFLAAARSIAGKTFSNRTYILNLPNNGNPKFGFHLCEKFINQNGELFISLYE